MEHDGEDKAYCIDQNADGATSLVADNMDKGMRLLKSPMVNESALSEDDMPMATVTHSQQYQTKRYFSEQRN